MELGLTIFLIIVGLGFLWFIIEVRKESRKLGKKKLKGMNVMGVQFK